jgi:hypothetical protein
MESLEERRIVERFADLLEIHSFRYLDIAQKLSTNKEITLSGGDLISVFRIEDGGVRISTPRDEGNTFHESSWALLTGDDATKLTSLIEAIAWHEAMQS